MKDKELYTRILDLPKPWEVKEVRLDLEKEEIVIEVVYGGARAPCPECGKACEKYDHRDMRRWRYLDTCQYKTYIECSVPRVNCREHKVKTIEVPWSERHNHYTKIFERFAIDILLSVKKQTKAAKILRLSFDQIHEIMKRAVRRGLRRRDVEDVPEYVGLDEKSIGRHHHYTSSFYDIKGQRVIDVEENRDEESARKLIDKSIPKDQRSRIKAIVIDFWKPYKKAARELLPETDIVYDHFHIIKQLNNAIDETRREEINNLDKDEKKNLKGIRYLLLKDPEVWTEKQRQRFKVIQAINAKVAQAWKLKEDFKGFFHCADVNEGIIYLTAWFRSVYQSELRYVKEAAKTFMRNIKGIINYLEHRITNSIAESINGLIKEIIYMARGFIAFENFRMSILFYLGKLDLYP